MDRLMEFNQHFQSDTDCFRLIYKLKWPSGFHCPVCNHRSAYTISTRKLPLYECRKCAHQTSLTSGTVMDKTRTSLRKWLIAMYVMATSDNSISAVGLAKLIHVSYKTAWAMLHKLRLVLSDADRNILLSGVVEAKLEIYKKQPIPTYDALQMEHAAIAARMTGPNRSPYLKIKLVHCEQSPRGFLTKQAEREFLDEHTDSNVTHIKINRRFINPYRCEAILPKLAKAAFHWMNETFHGIGMKYSQLYLNEFCFRYNHSTNPKRSAFEHLLQLCLGENKSIKTINHLHLSKAS